MDINYTQERVEEVVQAIFSQCLPNPHRATVVGLSGDLGAGKTTLVQGIAKTLGITETVTSPTFVIAKWYETNVTEWKTLIHIDAYRIEAEEELIPLGWEEMLNTPETLIVVEWPEKIATAVPPYTLQYMITHKDDSRHITQI